MSLRSNELPAGRLPDSARPDADGGVRHDESAAADRAVHVLFCTNAGYVQHVAVCLTSLLWNNPGLFFDIVVVGGAGERLDEDRLRRSLARFANHRLTILAFTPPADRLLPLNPRAHYTLDTWTRLWVADFFPATVARVLYLDGDIVVTGDISPLWSADLDGALLGAIDIPGSMRGVMMHQLRPEDGYFNAGVLLIDLPQWRQSGARDVALDYVARYPERVPDVDQDALNACFHARRKRLDYTWNAIWPFFREPLALPLARAEIERVRAEARIIHFNGASKPWSYFCNHPRRAEYDRYLHMTEWRDFVPPDRTLLNRLRKQVAAALPNEVKRPLKAIIGKTAALRRG